MRPKSIPPSPRGHEPVPEISPPPGDLPKKFPEATPLSDDGLEAAKKESASTMKAGSSGGGENPFVESGLPDHDPERPRETPEEQSMK
jgi:hypothetical protein